MKTLDSELVKDKRHFQISKPRNGDSLNISWNRYTKSYHLEVDEPWAGDTETGIGATTSIPLSIDELKAIRDWINEVTSEKENH